MARSQCSLGSCCTGEQNRTRPGQGSPVLLQHQGQAEGRAVPALRCPGTSFQCQHFLCVQERVCNWLQQPGSTGWAVCEAECNFYLQCESTVASSSWAALSLQPLKAVPGMGWRHTVLKPNSRGGPQHWTFPGPECSALRCLGSSMEEWLPQPSGRDNRSLVYRTCYRTAGRKDAFFFWSHFTQQTTPTQPLLHKSPGAALTGPRWCVP